MGRELHTRLHRTDSDFTRVPVQMRFRFAIARWSRRFHQSPTRRGRQQTTQAPSSIGARALGSASAKNFSDGWIASSPRLRGRHHASLRLFKAPFIHSTRNPGWILPRRRTSRPPLALSPTTTRLAEGHPTSRMMTKPKPIHIQLLISSFLTFRSGA